MSYRNRGDFSQINPAQCIDQLVLAELKTAGHHSVATALEPLVNLKYPDQLALSQAVTRILCHHFTEPVQAIIFKHADLGFRVFNENFGWVDKFEPVIPQYP